MRKNTVKCCYNEQGKYIKWYHETFKNSYYNDSISILLWV